ncbi:hypothetical protein PR048_000635 [Dryococelus australis]|uniref:Uncharacterized protein n=1 Tax=Dryococelus australis TaxID=614101 RepID=A0ABQ9IF73_9NEOP|nr:hypothetical protein PR048_000635 [Dryococelus australis]
MRINNDDSIDVLATTGYNFISKSGATMAKWRVSSPPNQPKWARCPAESLQDSRTWEYAGRTLFLQLLAIFTSPLPRRSEACVLVSPVSLPRFLTLDAQLRSPHKALCYMSAMRGRRSSAGMQGRGKLEISDKTCRLAASSGTVLTRKIPGVTRPGIEPSSTWWEVSGLTSQPPRSRQIGDFNKNANFFSRYSYALTQSYVLTSALTSLLTIGHSRAVDEQRILRRKRARVDVRSVRGILEGSASANESASFDYLEHGIKLSCDVRSNQCFFGQLCLTQFDGENTTACDRASRAKSGSADGTERLLSSDRGALHLQSARLNAQWLVLTFRPNSATPLTREAPKHRSGEPGTIPGGVAPGFQHVPDDARDLPCTVLLHSGAAPDVTSPFSSLKASLLKVLYTSAAPPPLPPSHSAPALSLPRHFAATSGFRLYSMLNHSIVTKLEQIDKKRISEPSIAAGGYSSLSMSNHFLPMAITRFGRTSSARFPAALPRTNAIPFVVYQRQNSPRADASHRVGAGTLEVELLSILPASLLLVECVGKLDSSVMTPTPSSPFRADAKISNPWVRVGRVLSGSHPTPLLQNSPSVWETVDIRGLSVVVANPLLCQRPYRCLRRLETRRREGIWAALNSEILRAHEGEVNMERRRNEGEGETEDSRENPPTGTIPICENPVTRPGIEPGSPWWEASVLIAQPPCSPPPPITLKTRYGRTYSTDDDDNEASASATQKCKRVAVDEDYLKLGQKKRGFEPSSLVLRYLATYLSQKNILVGIYREPSADSLMYLSRLVLCTILSTCRDMHGARAVSRPPDRRKQDSDRNKMAADPEILSLEPFPRSPSVDHLGYLQLPALALEPTISIYFRRKYKCKDTPSLLTMCQFYLPAKQILPSSLNTALRHLCIHEALISQQPWRRAALWILTDTNYLTVSVSDTGIPKYVANSPVSRVTLSVQLSSTRYQVRVLPIDTHYAMFTLICFIPVLITVRISATILVYVCMSLLSRTMRENHPLTNVVNNDAIVTLYVQSHKRCTPTPDNATGRQVFSGISRFPPPTGASPYSPHFTLISSHDFDVKSRPNLFTPSPIQLAESHGQHRERHVTPAGRPAFRRVVGRKSLGAERRGAAQHPAGFHDQFVLDPATGRAFSCRPSLHRDGVVYQLLLPAT